MAKISKLGRRKLGEILVGENLVTNEQLQEALAVQKETGELLGETLIRLGYVTERGIARAICKQFDLPYLNATTYEINAAAAALIQRQTMISSRFVVLDQIGKSLVVATAGLVDSSVFEELEKMTGAPPVIYVSTFGQVTGTLKKLFPDETFGNGSAT